MTVDAPVKHNVHPALHSLLIPLADVRALEGNPRRGDVEAVKKSYERFGQRKPIVVRQSTMEAEAGNHQRIAAGELGWTHIAAVIVDDDQDMAEAFALADNRTSDLGTYDPAALLAFLQRVQASQTTDLLAATGYSTKDVLALLAQVGGTDQALTDPDDVPTPPATPITVLGDVWELGRHRVACGSSTDPTLVHALMRGEQADAIWTDPPYGVDYTGKTKQALTIENDGRDLGDLETLLRDALSLAVQNTHAGAPVYVAAPAGPATLPFAIVLTELGVWRQTLVWEKDRFVLGHGDYHYRHEILYQGYTPGGVGRRGRGGEGWYGDNAQDTILAFNRPGASREHPTMKPVELIAYCLTQNTAAGDLVLDPFAGSGSTLIAAHGIQRDARLLELDPRYVDVICRRFQNHTGVKPIRTSTGKPVDFQE